jgi:hypothetical protein
VKLQVEVTLHLHLLAQPHLQSAGKQLQHWAAGRLLCSG